MPEPYKYDTVGNLTLFLFSAFLSKSKTGGFINNNICNECKRIETQIRYIWLSKGKTKKKHEKTDYKIDYKQWWSRRVRWRNWIWIKSSTQTRGIFTIFSTWNTMTFKCMYSKLMKYIQIYEIYRIYDVSITIRCIAPSKFVCWCVIRLARSVANTAQYIKCTAHRFWFTPLWTKRTL